MGKRRKPGYDRLPSGAYRYRGTVVDSQGREHRISGSGPTQREAYENWQRKREQLQDPGQAFTVAQWMDYYTTKYCRNHVTSTYLSKDIESAIRLYINPEFGSRTLGSLQFRDVQAWVDRLSHSEGYHSGELKAGKVRGKSGKRLSQKTVHNILTIFSKALDIAVEDHQLVVNPCKGVKVEDVRTPAEKLREQDRQNAHVLSKEQMQQFLQIVDTDEYRDPILLAVYTGMRRGEILGLAWEYVEAGKIRVVQQLKHEDGKPYYLGDTKGQRSRDIYRNDLIDAVLDSAKQYQESCQALAGVGWKPEWNLVFTKPDGSHLSPNTFYHHVKALGVRIGCPWLTVHDLRRSYATLMVVEGQMTVKQVQEVLGHVDLSTTLDHYVKAQDVIGPRLAQQAGAFFERLKQEKQDPGSDEAGAEGSDVTRKQA